MQGADSTRQISCGSETQAHEEHGRHRLTNEATLDLSRSKWLRLAPNAHAATTVTRTTPCEATNSRCRPANATPPWASQDTVPHQPALHAVQCNVPSKLTSCCSALTLCTQHVKLPSLGVWVDALDGHLATLDPVSGQILWGVALPVCTRCARHNMCSAHNQPLSSAFGRGALRQARTILHACVWTQPALLAYSWAAVLQAY